MTTTTPDEYSIDTTEAIFIVAFTEDGDGMMMEAVGELEGKDDRRRAIVTALHGLADKLEERESHGNTH